MKRTGVAGARLLALILMGAALDLSGCASIDSALTRREATHAARPVQPTLANSGEGAEAQAESPPAAAPVAPTPPPPAAVVQAAPVAVENGSDTGTSVNKSIQSLRGQLQTIETALAAAAQRQSEISGRDAQAITTYEEGDAHIAIRLQVGTTRGNPQLVGEWNNAQSALDTLTSDINALAAIGTELSGQSASARQILQTVGATLNAPGAVDEDHRQLTVLDDEAHRTVATLDRMLTEIGHTVERQTAYVAAERPRLARLAGAIRSGELENGVAAPFMNSGMNSAMHSAVEASPTVAGAPIATIKFDHAGTDYQKMLYAALSQSLQSRPSASFEVVAVSPTRGTAKAVQLAQIDAEHHAQDVMHSMNQMGVPPARMGVSSSTDPAIATTEVRVYVK